MFTIYHDLTIQAEVSKVFEAVAIPEHLNNWWTKESSGIPALGNIYRLFFSEAYDWDAEVTICITNEHFELTMTKADSDWTPTKFGFILHGENGKTQVQFYHTNWQSTNHHYRRTNFCWALLLQGLKQYVESNIIIPFEQRN